MNDVNKEGVERFDLDQPETHMGLAYMQSESYGDYVRYSDYAILRTEKHADAEAMAALQAELDSAQTDLAKVILSLPTSKGERASGAVEGVKMLRSRLEAELDDAITRAEEAEKARDEWCEVSQNNYQLARDMEKRLIDTAQPTD